MTTLLALTSISFPVFILLAMITVVSLVAPFEWDKMWEYVFAISVVLIAIILAFNIVVEIIISVTNFCALI